MGKGGASGEAWRHGSKEDFGLTGHGGQVGSEADGGGRRRSHPLTHSPRIKSGLWYNFFLTPRECWLLLLG